MTIKILLADDHKILSKGLRILLEKQSGMQVVGEADNGRMAVEMAAELLPDVILMDIGMPDLNGMSATRQITERTPRARVIALSMHSDRHFVGEMLKAGAAGYILKDCSFDEIVTAIRSVAEGKTHLSPSIQGTLVQEFVRRPQAEKQDGPDLTAKEREVLQLLAEGRTTKEIASRLHVSSKTVETHRQHIMDKLDIHSVAELTKYAVRQGLTSLED